MPIFTLAGGYRPFLPFNAPPAVLCALSLIAGITCAYLGLAATLTGSVLFLVAITACFLKKNLSLTKSIILVFCFSVGVVRFIQFTQYREKLFPLYHTTLEGRVQSISYSDNAPWHYQITLDVKRMYNNEQWKGCPCVLSIYTYKIPHCKIDDTIHCSIDQIQPPVGEFKWYLYKENLDASVFQKQMTIDVLHRPTYSFKRWIAQQRKSLHIALSKKLSPHAFALFSSLFLGNRTAIKQDLEEQKPLFKVWGISHFLARSGLHLLIFIMLLQKLLTLLPARFFLKQVLLIAISCVYFLFSWTSISFNRAFYTFIFLKTTTLFALPLHSMHAIALVACTLLLISPLQLFFLDFQLTFLLTFCLIWIAHTHHQRRMLFTQKIASPE